MTISNVTDLASFSGTQFIVFAGSYVSKLGEIAPTVPEIRKDIFLQLEQIILANPADRAAAYIGNLVASALRGNILTALGLSSKAICNAIDALKFEELLRRMQDLNGDVNFLDRFIAASYLVPAGSYNENHAAIAGLLRSGHCYCVLTTNFDTGIENACTASGFAPPVLTLKDLKNTSPANLRGAIIKLHGCANRKDIVANSTDLLRLADRAAFSIVEALATSHKCITFGYSGVGDIDIALHLRKAPAGQIAWSNYRLGKNPFPGSTFVRCDLKETDPNSNLLIALAEKHGTVITKGTPPPSYSPRVHNFFLHDCDYDFAREAMLDLAGHYYPRIHLAYWFASGRRNLISTKRYYVKDPRLLGIPLNAECRGELLQYTSFDANYARLWNAFIDWRLGNDRVALETVREVLLSTIKATDDASRSLVIRACEIAFGIGAEGLWLRKGQRQSRFAKELAPVTAIVNSLEREIWFSEHEPVDIRIKREKRRAEIEYCLSRDKHKAISKISLMFDTARDLELWSHLPEIVNSARLIDKVSGDNLESKIAEAECELKRAPIPNRFTLATKKKRFAHKLYHLPLVGRLLYRLIEKWAERMAEIVYDGYWKIRYHDAPHIISSCTARFP